MRAFENRNAGRSRTCSYCGDSNHVVTSCLHAEHDWLKWSKHQVPIVTTSTNRYYRWYRSDYTKWYNNASKAYQKIENFREREKQKAAGTATPRRRAAPTCGFCSDPNHNRRNCTKMQRVIADAQQANRNWRRAFYKALVKDHGISEGAAIKGKVKRGYRSEEETVIGLVTSVNWNKVSFLSVNDGCLNWDYRQPLEIKVLVEGEYLELMLPDSLYLKQHDGSRKTIVKSGYSYWNRMTFLESLTRSEKELEESWVTDGVQDEFTWLTKKRSHDRLTELGIISAINRWK